MKVGQQGMPLCVYKHLWFHWQVNRLNRLHKKKDSALSSAIAGLHRVKNKLAQEGHGGITPTDPMLIPEEVFKLIKKVKGALPSPEKLTPRQKKLYELIWRRTLASQMTDSVLKKVKVMHLNDRVLQLNQLVMACQLTLRFIIQHSKQHAK